MKDLVGQTLGHYRIEAALGTGGMGQVFRGRHVYLERLAAVKVMHDHMATHPAFRTRFLQEARLTAALKSPHIVEIYEFGEQDGLLYLIIELMTEGTLTSLLRQYAGKRIEAVEQARWLLVGLDLIRQAAEGLVAAHALGMIHRDIKPDNLLLTRPSSSDEQYQLKVSDFGLARLPESSGLSMGYPVGTPAYMSPEQCQNRTLDGRSDLYSLGVVLYEVVTGYLPFQINSFGDAVQKHVNALPPPPQQVCPNLPPAVEQIILRCLAKVPQERYQTAQELADTLQEAINRIGVEPGAALIPPAPPSQAPRVRISDLSGQTIRVGEVTRQGVIIGRQSDCDLVLVAETISRHHLQVKWDGYQTTVTDLRSSYGTILGNEKLMPQVSRVWEEQQTVSIGPFSLRLEAPGALEVPLAKEGKVELAPVMPQSPQNNRLPRALHSQAKTRRFWVDAIPVIRRRLQAKNVELVKRALAPKWLLFACAVLLMVFLSLMPVINMVGSGLPKPNTTYTPVSGHPSPTVPALNPNTVAHLEKKWTFTTNDHVYSSPAVVDGVVYIGSDDNSVYAIDAQSGQRKWVFPAGSFVFSSPAVVNGVIYIGSGSGKVYAIDAQSGQQKWVFQAGSSLGVGRYIAPSPKVVNGIVYIGSDDKNVYAIDALSGQQKWAFPTGGPVDSSPAVIDGVVYIGSDDKNVYAIDAQSGQQKWVFPAGDSVRSSPAVVDRVVYVGSMDKNVYAIDAQSGQKKWVSPTNGMVESSPAVVDRVVYIGSDDDSVYAIDAQSGQKKWVSPTGDSVYSSPAVVDGVVYIGSDDKNVYAIDAQSGQKRWNFQTGDMVFSSPMVVNNVVYVGSNDKNVYAFGLPATTS